MLAKRFHFWDGLRPFADTSNVHTSFAHTHLHNAYPKFGSAVLSKWRQFESQLHFDVVSFHHETTLPKLISNMQWLKPISNYLHHLRWLLTEELEYFGPGAFGDQLDAAYKHFVSFCRSQHIRHSQAPFLPKMVTWKQFLFGFNFGLQF